MGDRFYLKQREDGLWNVIDRLSGGPAEVAGYVLYGLERQDAEDLVEALAWEDARVLERLDAIVRSGSKPGRGGD